MISNDTYVSIYFFDGPAPRFRRVAALNIMAKFQNGEKAHQPLLSSMLGFVDQHRNRIWASPECKFSGINRNLDDCSPGGK